MIQPTFSIVAGLRHLCKGMLPGLLLAAPLAAQEGDWLDRFFEDALGGERLELDGAELEQLLERYFPPEAGGRRDWRQPGDRESIERFLRRFGEAAPGSSGLPSEMDAIPPEDEAALDRHYRELVAAHRPAVAVARESTVRFWRGKLPLAYGIVVRSDGWALSKASELAKADGMLRCQLPDGREVRGEVKTAFPVYDLALVRLEADHLRPAEWHLPPPRLGTFLAAPGLDDDPLAIGVVSVAPRNLDKGFLGVALEERDGAVFVTEVIPTTAASRAGIMAGDRIRAVDGRPAASMTDLMRRVAGFRSGSEVAVEIERNGVRRELAVDLGRRPEAGGASPRGEMMQRMGSRLSESRGGYPNALQHDLPLTPEQCGGPLVDLEGRIIGLNIARAGRIKSYALPASTLAELLDGVEWES